MCHYLQVPICCSFKIKIDIKVVIIPNEYHTISRVNLEKFVKIKICDSRIVRLILMDGALDRNSSLLPIEVASFCSVEEPIIELAIISEVDPVS